VEVLRAVGRAAETVGSVSRQILSALVFGFRHVAAPQPHRALHSDTYLNIEALVLAVELMTRFLRAGGRPMRSPTGGPPEGVATWKMMYP
jgi:hypothetical protein